RAVVDGGVPSFYAREDYQRLARLLRDESFPAAVEEVHALFRAHSPAANPGLNLLAASLRFAAHGGALAQVEAVLPPGRELPTSEPMVRHNVALVLGSVALASSKAGQSERSRQEARAALALDDTTPEAYLALGEYQFQDNDLSGALDTWERGLRLNPGDVQL